MTYTNPVNEEAYENSIIELFEGMEYTHVYAPDIENRDFYSPLYEPVLTNSLHAINPNLPDEAINEALYKLKNFENADLVQKNAVFTDYLQNGITVRYTEKGEPREIGRAHV